MSDCKVNLKTDLRAENDDLKKALYAAREDVKRLEELLQVKGGMIKNLRAENRFLEGQIEAYQYCMNSRR